MQPHRHTSFVLACAAGVLLTAPALGQEAPSAAQPSAPPGVSRGATNVDPVAAFLSRTAQRQQRRDQALSTRGKGDNLRQLNGLLQGAKIAPSGLGRNPAERTQLESSLSIEVAQFLAATGFNPGDVQRLQRGGLDLGEAASATIRGSATFPQEAALAEVVVVAETTGAMQPSTPDDGFGSSIPFRVIETLKGPLPSGTAFQLRQRSGAQADVSTDLRPQSGTRFLLLLSSGLYQQEAAEHGGRGHASAFMQLVPGYFVLGEELRPTGIGQPRVTSLAQARSAVATIPK